MLRLMVMTSLLLSDGSTSKLKVGDQAPAFSLPASNGKTIQLSDFLGRKVVLAFFPKAFTGG